MATLVAPEVDTANPWQRIIGQQAAVEQLQAGASTPVHAYLFVGPEGVGKREAARIFAAAILSDSFSAPDTARTLRLAQTEQLVDLTVIEPEGRFMLIADAQRAILAAGRPPIEKKRKVIVIDRFHVASPEVAPSLLKTIEEPQNSVVLIILSQFIPKEHDTIASRCVKVAFSALSTDEIKNWLLSNSEFSLDENSAQEIAGASLGNQARARLLASDSRFWHRLRFWQQAPGRCGTYGADATSLTDELLNLLKESQNPLLEAHQQEIDQQAEETEKFKVSVGSKKALDQRHRRELRQFREQELRWGFSVLAHSYWQELQQVLGAQAHSEPGYQLQELCSQALAKLRDVQAEMKRNPNETLMLQNLFLHLPHLNRLKA